MDTDKQVIKDAYERLTKQEQEDDNAKKRDILQQKIDAIGRKLGCSDGDIGTATRPPVGTVGDYGFSRCPSFLARWRLPSGYVLGFGSGQPVFDPWHNSQDFDNFYLLDPGAPINGDIAFDHIRCIFPPDFPWGDFDQNQTILKHTYELQQKIPKEHLNGLACISWEDFISREKDSIDGWIDYFWTENPKSRKVIIAETKTVYKFE